MTSKSYSNAEIIQVIEAVSREKDISIESVIKALEETIATVAKRKYGLGESLKAKIDRKNGEIKIYREMLVISDQDMKNKLASEVNESDVMEISLNDAKLKNADANVGDFLYEQLPMLDLNRLIAYASKNLIISKVKEIERIKQYDEFIDRVGTILFGIVEKIDSRSLLIKIGSAEAVLRKDQMIRTDNYRNGDKVRSYLVEINRENKGPQLILSRTHNDFLKCLLVNEVPEIEDGIILIKSIVREPGSRAKVAVYSPDGLVDPIGSCIGIKGSRIQAISSELNGEKIDIVLWSSDIAQFAINALSPLQVQKVIVDEDNEKIELVIDEENKSIAIGRRGQNIRLISQLIGWHVTVLTENEELERRTNETGKLVDLFMSKLDIDDMLAQLLVSEGYNSIEELAQINTEDLMEIQGLDESISAEIIARAKEALNHQNENKDLFSVTSNRDQYISNISQNDIANVLKQLNVKKIKQVADLSSHELLEMFDSQGVTISSQKADEIIMTARKKTYPHLF